MYADTSETLSASSEVGQTAADTAAAAAAAAGGDDDDDDEDEDEGDGSTPLAGGDGLSGSQRELVDIMQQVKTKHLTVDEAEEFFYDWKARHDRGFSRSFREKQVSSSSSRLIGSFGRVLNSSSPLSLNYFLQGLYIFYVELELTVSTSLSLLVRLSPSLVNV